MALNFEPITFIVALNDSDELRHNLLASTIAANPAHQWLIIENHGNAQYQNIGQLYCNAASQANHDLLFFIHQDVFLPPQWEEQMFASLKQLEEIDNNWGVLGAAGVVPVHGGYSKIFVGHWKDPNGYIKKGVFPQEVLSLDEMWLGMRKQRNLDFDPYLPGFHCYGIDISLSARKQGLKSYVIDVYVWHKHRDSRGNVIFRSEESEKIQHRKTEKFQKEFLKSAKYVQRKWRDCLPFHSTSWSWG